MHEPAISVVVPTHDRVSLLARAIKSVLAQSFERFELIVVDDGSSDDTAQFVESVGDDRVRALSHEQALGVAAARNTGVRHARAPLVAFLDDDDEYEPEFLSRMHEAFDGSPVSVGLAWCGICWMHDDANGERVVHPHDLWWPRFASREQAYRGFLRARRIGTNSGLVLRRSVFDRVGDFDASLKCASDTEFLIRVVREFDFTVVPEPLIRVHGHDGPRLRSSPPRAATYRKIIERHRAVLESDADLWADVHYKTGWVHYHAGDRSAGRRFMLSALKRRPWHRKALGALLLFEVSGRRAPQLHTRLSNVRRRFRTPTGVSSG